MKLLKLLAALAIAAAPLSVAHADGDTLTVQSAVPSTCTITGDWAYAPANGGLTLSGTSAAGATLTFTSTQLVDPANGEARTDEPGYVFPTFRIRAPIYCNGAVTAQIHATNGALKYQGTVPPGTPFGSRWPEVVAFGFRNSLSAPGDNSGAFVGSCTTGSNGQCSNVGSGTPFNSGVLTVPGSAAPTIAAIDINYGLSHAYSFPSTTPLKMIAGAYSETLILTITPQ
jgi:hypothetical protein